MGNFAACDFRAIVVDHGKVVIRLRKGNRVGAVPEFRIGRGSNLQGAAPSDIKNAWTTPP